MSIVNDPNRMLSTEEAAAFMGLQPCTLAAWREDGAQPDLPFFKIGKAVRYRCADVLAFLEARRAVSTLEARQIMPTVRTSKSDDGRERQATPNAGRSKRKNAASAETGLDGQQKLF